MLHKINTGNFHILYLIEFETDVTALLISILLQLYIMSVNNFIVHNVECNSNFPNADAQRGINPIYISRAFFNHFLLRGQKNQKGTFYA